jgi:hypothetical protein
MAYATGNPPSCVTQRVGATGGAFWVYNSTDAATAVRVAGYITNGYALGIRVGDLVFQVDTAGGTVGHIYQVNSVTVGGAVDLTDGTAITATDTD